MSTTMDVETVIAEADRDFPALYQLFGGYFHEDWNDESATPDAALRTFLEEASAEAVAAARGELDRLMSSGFDDATLARVLEEGFACNYRPGSDGVATSEWLASVRDALRA